MSRADRDRQPGHDGPPRRRVLITNDDGIASPGLHALAAAAVAAGQEVVVAAPAAEASGSSAALTGSDAEGRITVTAAAVPGLPEVPAHAVHAGPALITLVAAHGAFGPPPEVVLSGINRGANVGRAVLHSGTVGAALTAGTNGIRAIAFSLDIGLSDPAPEDHHWQQAARLLPSLLELLESAPAGTVLNVNAPNTPAERPAELRSAPLAAFGIVQTTAAQLGEPGAAAVEPGSTLPSSPAAPAEPAEASGSAEPAEPMEPMEPAVRLTVAELGLELDPASDAALLTRGHATITALSGIGELPLPGSIDMQ